MQVNTLKFIWQGNSFRVFKPSSVLQAVRTLTSEMLTLNKSWKKITRTALFQ